VRRLDGAFDSELRVYAGFQFAVIRLKPELQTIQSGVKPPRSKKLLSGLFQ
jgi:hypothetical protein